MDLDPTGRSDVSPQFVARALYQWARVCQQSRRELANANNDYTIYLASTVI